MGFIEIWIEVVEVLLTCFNYFFILLYLYYFVLVILTSPNYLDLLDPNNKMNGKNILMNEDKIRHRGRFIDMNVIRPEALELCNRDNFNSDQEQFDAMCYYVDEVMGDEVPRYNSPEAYEYHQNVEFIDSMRVFMDHFIQFDNEGWK